MNTDQRPTVPLCFADRLELAWTALRMQHERVGQTAPYNVFVLAAFWSMDFGSDLTALVEGLQMRLMAEGIA